MQPGLEVGLEYAGSVLLLLFCVLFCKLCVRCCTEEEKDGTEWCSEYPVTIRHRPHDTRTTNGLVNYRYDPCDDYPADESRENAEYRNAMRANYPAFAGVICRENAVGWQATHAGEKSGPISRWVQGAWKVAASRVRMLQPTTTTTAARNSSPWVLPPLKPMPVMKPSQFLVEQAAIAAVIYASRQQRALAKDKREDSARAVDRREAIQIV